MKRHQTRYPGIYYRLDSKGERRYQIWYRGSDGKDHWETLPRGTTEAQAGKRRAAVVGDLGRGVQVAPSSRTFELVAEEWISDRSRDPDIRPSTLGQNTWAVRKHLIPRFGSRKLHEIAVSDVARFVKDKQVDGMKANSINGILAPLSAIMALAQRDGRVQVNPVRALLKKERPKPDTKKIEALTSEEIESLFAAVGDADRVLVKTLVGTGLRISEALDLVWGDIQEHLITVRSSKTDAGEREVVMQPGLRRVLLEHKMACSAKSDEDRVFADAGTRRAVGARVMRAAGCTLHTLRHTHASILISQGVDVTAVAAQMGHSSPTITLSTYAHMFDPKARREEMRMKLETAIGGLL